jgi:hypothetical protein
MESIQRLRVKTWRSEAKCDDEDPPALIEVLANWGKIAADPTKVKARHDRAAKNLSTGRLRLSKSLARPRLAR